MGTLDLSPDEVLSTTRSVRKRLDFSRPVPRELIRECVDLAVQAPAGSNLQRTRFVVVEDRGLRQELGDLYRQVYTEQYRESASFVGTVQTVSDSESARQARVAESVEYLADHIAEAPVLVIGCLAGMRIDTGDSVRAPVFLGQTFPAMWSFMLAARARGLGTCWTAMHLFREREAAEVLGVPYDSVQQVCMTPVAYTVGPHFRRAAREEADFYIHWDRWDPTKPFPAPWSGLSKGGGPRRAEDSSGNADA